MKVLLSSAGRRGELVKLVRRTQARLGLPDAVIGADMSPLSAAGQLSNHLAVVPRCTDDEFVPAMLDLVRTHDVAIVVPTIDTELAVYAAHRADFEAAGATVLISDPDVVRTATDKRATASFFEANGLPHPRTGTVDEALGWSTDAYPVIAKPAEGSASIGIVEAESATALADLVLDDHYVVQSRAAGAEITVDVWVGPDGRAVDVVLRKRLEVRAGEVSKGITVRHDRLTEVVGRAVNALDGARGPLTLQAFVEGDEVSLIEINARLGGGYPLAHEAGADFFAHAFAERSGRAPRPSQWREGVVLLRYDASVIVEAGDVGLS